MHASAESMELDGVCSHAIFRRSSRGGAPEVSCWNFITFLPICFVTPIFLLTQLMPGFLPSFVPILPFMLRVRVRVCVFFTVLETTPTGKAYLGRPYHSFGPYSLARFPFYFCLHMFETSLIHPTAL